MDSNPILAKQKLDAEMNPIDSGSNFIKKKYIKKYRKIQNMWQAKFSNGEILNEFNVDGQEILFGKVLKRLDDLESLSIILDDKTFTVRMIDGRFSSNISGDINHFFASDVDITALKNIRPIYFVRETIKLAIYSNTSSFGGSSPDVNFTALGFQANLDGRNITKYLAILPNGTFIIKDE